MFGKRPTINEKEAREGQLFKKLKLNLSVNQKSRFIALIPDGPTERAVNYKSLFSLLSLFPIIALVLVSVSSVCGVGDVVIVVPCVQAKDWRLVPVQGMPRATLVTCIRDGQLGCVSVECTIAADLGAVAAT